MYEPAGQAVKHAPDPAKEKVPAAQLAQPDAPLDEYRPAAQLEQLV